MFFSLQLFPFIEKSDYFIQKTIMIYTFGKEQVRKVFVKVTFSHKFIICAWLPDLVHSLRIRCQLMRQK